MLILNTLSRRLVLNNIRKLERFQITEKLHPPKYSNYSTKKHIQQDEVEIDDSPIKYSTSKASKHKASISRSGIAVERLWYEPYVILASVAVFLVYFCILREENDIDQELTQSLFSRIEGLEEHELRQLLKRYQREGLATDEVLKRLEEVQRRKNG